MGPMAFCCCQISYVLMNKIQVRTRKIGHNSTVKMEPTKGRKIKTSRSGKIAIQWTPSLDLAPSVKMGTVGACIYACSKAEQCIPNKSDKL